MRSAPAVTPMVQLDALGPTGAYRARSRSTILDVTGTAVAELSLVPGLFVSRAMPALRKAEPLGEAERRSAMARAGEIFRKNELGGLSPTEYQDLVCRVSGLPISVVRASTERIASYCIEAHDHTTYAMPAGTVTSWRDSRTQSGAAIWARRGEVFGVHAAGNHPAVHANWLQALAFGYRVAVRPSRREPFTPYRLIAALRAAGFHDDHVVLLPTDHNAADEMIKGSDRSMVYGGDDVMRKYAAQPEVLPQGPGRSKILITADTDWRDHIDMIVSSVSKNAGVSCTNTTSIFVEKDTEQFATALAARLADLPTRSPLQDDAVLPVQPVETARAIETYLEAAAKCSQPILGGNGIVDDLGDGSAVLRPAVLLLNSPDDEQAGIELPFPCVWVAPWTRESGVGPFHDTLTLTLLSEDESLVETLLRAHGIRNLYIGSYPTTWSAPGVPHDGYLADFLMESKGIIRT